MFFWIAFNVMSGSLQGALQWRSSNSLCLIPLLNVSIIVDHVVEKCSLYLNILWISFASGKLSNKKNISSVSILRFCFWLQKCRFERLEVHQTLILKKDQHFDAKSAQNLHILKKSKVLIVKSHQTCIYSKKSKKIKNQFIYASQSHIESEIFDFFEYMQVWWLFTIKTFDFFEYMQVLCTFGIKMLIFFEYMQVWWTSSPSNLHIHKKTNILIGNSSEPAYT